MVDIQQIPCHKCGGTMSTQKIFQHNRGLSITLIVLGVLISLTIVGTLIGVPMAIAGVVMMSKSKLYWICPKCGDKKEKYLVAAGK